MRDCQVTGKFIQYSVEDIVKLIYADCGLVTDENMRTKGQLFYLGDTLHGMRDNTGNSKVLEVHVYDDTFDKRMEDSEPR